jgi:hypothetical protein
MNELTSKARKMLNVVESCEGYEQALASLESAIRFQWEGEEAPAPLAAALAALALAREAFVAVDAAVESE